MGFAKTLEVANVSSFLVHTVVPARLLFQIFNLFPWVRALTANKRLFDKLFFDNKTLNLHLFGRLKETLNPQLPRGFVDAFMVHEQNLEVGAVQALSQFSISCAD